MNTIEECVAALVETQGAVAKVSDEVSALGDRIDEESSSTADQKDRIDELEEQLSSMPDSGDIVSTNDLSDLNDKIDENATALEESNNRLTEMESRYAKLIDRLHKQDPDFFVDL